MIHPLFEGILIGLTMAVMLGPALFALLQTSLHRGTRAGVILAFGIFLSDFLIVVLSYLGAAQLLNQGKKSLVVGLIGGTILIIYGIVTLTRKVQINDSNNLIEARHVPGPLTFLFKGFFLNFANPFVWFFWFTIMMGISGTYGSEFGAVSSLFGGVLITIFSTDVLKVFIASSIKKYMTPQLMNLVNYVVGILLAIFGVILIIRSTITF
ncbi:MAG: LysE family transporter [Bacteroidota bacterium]|nr:LysE family transporter [Bacteroidota bacterium]